MGLVTGDPELVEENIKSGVTLFDVVGAYPLAGVPKTGSEISNTPGEDGDLQMGVELPNPRFTSNLDGTVTDNLTGLIWLQNASCPEAWAIWPTAMSYVTQLNTNGTMNGNHCGDFSNSGSHQTDWRLPNIRELQSLVHFGFFDPVVPNTAGTSKYSWGDPFYFLQSSYYWSSTTFSANTLIAFQIFMQNGLTHFTNKTNSLGYVWPVRAGI
jgi:Protein of unknown function (DUF1566)